MNNGLIFIGAIILTASIFGYIYSDSQQGLLEQGQDIITGNQQNWSLVQSLSTAGIVGGIILIIAGIVPEKWENNSG